MDFHTAEKAVLSACLRDEAGGSASKAIEHLTSDDFVNPLHSRIFDLIIEHSPMNEIDVAIHLPEDASDAMEIANAYGGGSIDRYIDILVEARNLRSVDRAILSAQDEVKEGKSAEEIAGGFNTRVAKALTKGRGQVRVGTAANEAYAEFLNIDAGDSSAVSTGFNKLDLILGGGFRPGALYVMAARPGVGKSAFAVQLSHGIAKHGLRVAYASLEMGAAECSGRLLSHDSGVARPRQKGDLTNEDRKKLEDSKNRMRGWPITFKDDSSATVDSFRAFLAQEVIQGQVGLAVIDYLQLLSAPGHESRVQEVSHISRTLKQTSMELGVPILALSQLNRALESQNRKPVISDLRESGSIEQDADCVFLLSRDEDDGNPRKIHFNVAKNRNGESMATKMDFYPASGRFNLSPPKPVLNDDKPIKKALW